MTMCKTLIFKSVICVASWITILSFGAFAVSQEPDPTPEQLDFFERKVRPLLIENCHECHSLAEQENQGGLLLDSRAAILKGGDSGEAIVPGKPDASLLIAAVRYEDYEMPPSGKLADAEIRVLEEWVEMGAPWPAGQGAGGPALEVFDLDARRNEHWVWQPIEKSSRPKTNSERWSRSAIDEFIFESMENEGIEPAGRADSLAVARRLQMDLTGLPASAEELEQFAREAVEDRDVAIENLVDRLLASPHFGERWGRHWLDLTRYAESRGHEFDNDIPNAFQYRDYVIRAFNADVPYDQLVREHIAGDLLETPRLHPVKNFNESILGTGFWFLGEWVHSPVDIRKDESDRFDNMIDVATKTFQGVTVSCARCHDHKFDAISTADYYSLTGFLHSSDYRQVRFESLEQNRSVANELAKVDQQFQTQILRLLFERGVKLPAQSSFLNSPGIVFDYATLAQSKYIQDGYIFGRRAVQAGRPYFALEGGAPVVKVATHGSAINDPIWNKLQSKSEGVIQDRNKLTKIPKSGRTLRTPTFELESGKLACLVSGQGHIVACVDSHRLVNGPLHGQTIKSFETTTGQEWVSLNLERYVGHRLHLEFVPATKKQLSVRLITQGLGSDGLAAIDKNLKQLDAPFVEFAKAAMETMNVAGQSKVKRVVFEDFENGYGGWVTEGKAFGDTPQSLQTIGSYQGKINGVGTYFVNSHNIRNIEGNDDAKKVGPGDALTGTLTSPEFTIDCDAIEFLVGGGAHQNKTCVNLLVNGRVVKTATGRNNNQMFPHSWDVSGLKGKQARIQVVDKFSRGWGNVGFDHVVFVTGSKAAVLNGEFSQLIEQWKAARKKAAEQMVLTSKVAPAMLDGTGEEANIYIRGNASKLGRTEPRHFLTAIAGDQPMEIGRGSGRLELAEKINDPKNPLTSRVIVNRVWHYLMGRGLVPTTDDFGVLGQRPTHPKLLDYLASEFIEDGQSIKRLIKKIVLTETYQMSSRSNAKSRETDPKNLFWHHRPPKRLEGEAIRDSLLSLGGSLNPKMEGPPVPIHLTSFMDGRGRPRVNGPLDGEGRRSIYVAVRRNFISPFMLAFDTPVPFSTMGRRNVSNVPAQALILMNDPFVASQANNWAKRTIQFSESNQDRVNWMYRTAFGRSPTSVELETSLNYVGKKNDVETWSQFAHALINTKEFIFLR